MLFNSYIFIFAFLPLVLAVFYGLRGHDPRLRIYWLVLASFFFYGWWSPPYVLLLAVFVVANFAFGRLIERTRSKPWLVIGICFNLSLILYYKYFYFILSQFMPGPKIEDLFPWASPLLPLGISFFTFQKIAYLVDTYQRKVIKHTFGEYALFVTFFPQLIAGPIVHQKEILPQLVNFTRKPSARWIALGLACFILGLAKKTLLADPLGTVAEPLFDQSLTAPLSFTQGWLAALSYSLQLYFDFSGLFRYGDRAGVVIRHSPAAEFLFAVQGRQYYRFLAPLAYNTVAVPARLRVYSARRKQARAGAALSQSDADDAGRRVMAWCGLDVCTMGRTAWHVSMYQSSVETYRREDSARIVLACHFYSGGLCVGVVPRGKYGFSDQRLARYDHAFF
jgi:hypothetical protein